MKKAVVPFFACVILFAGCGGGSPLGAVGAPPVTESPVKDTVSDNIAKEMGEQMAEEMIGEGVDIEYAEEGSGEVVAWPSQMPSDVPEFVYGKIDATMAAPNDDGNNTIMLQLREVEEGAYDKYEQDLIGAGWVITTDTSVWTDGHITAEKEGRTIDVDVNPMGENTAFLYYFGE